MSSARKRQKTPWIVGRQVDVAEFFGVSVDTVKSWAKQQMPGQVGAYDVSQIAKWLRSVGPWRQHARPDPSEDPLLADGDSPGLERYRMAKAALAELDLEVRYGSLLERDKVRTALGRFAGIFRRLGEQLGKLYGEAATRAVNDSLSECQYVINEFGDSTTTDSEPPG